MDSLGLAAARQIAEQAMDDAAGWRCGSPWR